MQIYGLTPGKCQFSLFKLSYFLLHSLPDNHAAVKHQRGQTIYVPL